MSDILLGLVIGSITGTAVPLLVAWRPLWRPLWRLGWWRYKRSLARRGPGHDLVTTYPSGGVTIGTCYCTEGHTKC